MALIEDVFKGNLAAGLAIGVGGYNIRADRYPDDGEHFAAGGQDIDKGRYGFLPRNPERDRGNCDRSRRRGESRTRSGG